LSDKVVVGVTVLHFVTYLKYVIEIKIWMFGIYFIINS